mmetsp:Transcript_20607/g.60205  ORF Transcript_20607/g.60205 Transcript_20607/m.60205 type:complete len:350 (+) Transcript_20607:107-1156(+)
MDFKYWRPFVLFLCKLSPEDGSYVPQSGMINLISQMMKRGKGLSIVAGVLKGEHRENLDLLESARAHLGNKLVEKQIEGFPEIVCAPTVHDGYKFLVNAKGLGILRPNTVMIGWPRQRLEDRHAQEYVYLVEHVAMSKKTLLMCKGSEDFPDNHERGIRGYIDVWWIFDLFPANGLLLLIPYLLQQHRVWKHTTIRLFAVAQPSMDLTVLRRLLEGMMKAGGIVAKVQVLHMDPKKEPRFSHAMQCSPAGGLQFDVDGLSVSASPIDTSAVEVADKDLPEDATGSKMAALLAKHSGDSPLVLMTLPKRQHDAGQGASEWMESIDLLVGDMKRVIFIQESGHERIQFFYD